LTWWLNSTIIIYKTSTRTQICATQKPYQNTKTKKEYKQTNKSRKCNNNRKQIYKLSARTKVTHPGNFGRLIRENHKIAQNLFEGSDGIPNNVEFFRTG
jgi:hypothetical protein